MDRQTFEMLLTEHQDAIYAYARSLARHREDAEDIAQETFLRLWRSREDIEVDSARYWLLRVCRNLCLDRHRRKQVRSRARDHSERAVVGIETAEDDGRERSLEVSDLGGGALQTETSLDIQRLVQAMEELPEPHRSIMLLREVQDLAYDEIAETLELSLSAVKVYLHRARKKIRAAFPELDPQNNPDEKGASA